MHNADGGESAQQTRKRGWMRGGGAGERGHILGLLPEMVRETKFRRGMYDLGDPAASQQAVHGPSGLTALGLVFRHFSLPPLLTAVTTQITVADTGVAPKLALGGCGGVVP
jgi:hypothetical protein